MLPYLAIGGAVVPSLGLLEGGKLEYDHAFDRCTLKDFLAAIVCAGCDGVAGQRGRDILRIGVKLRLVAGSLAREDYIGDHVCFLLFRFKFGWDQPSPRAQARKSGPLTRAHKRSMPSVGASF